LPEFSADPGWQTSEAVRTEAAGFPQPDAGLDRMERRRVAAKMGA
jgi:hypothetical protein